MLRNLWKQLLTRAVSPDPRTRKLGRQPSFIRPQLETLEIRITPALTLNSSYPGLNFGNTQGYVPPDTNGAAGTVQYVETVNQTLRLSTKATGATLATDTFSHFWYTVGGLTQTDGGSGLSDPIVVWDDQIQRFIVGDQDVDFTTHVSNFDIAVSKTATPTTLTSADWNFYKVSTTEANEDADYPGNFGYNADAFVFCLNMFAANASGNDHVLVSSVSIQDLVNGVSQSNLHSYHNDMLNEFDMRPTVMHDSVTGDPMWLVTETGDGKHIDVYKMTNVLSNSAGFADTQLTVNSYTEITGSLGTPKQPNGTATTTNIDSRIMKSAEADNTIVAAQAVTDASGDRDLARWYEIDVSTGTPTLKDQGNVNNLPNVYDVYPGIDINENGYIGMSYMESSHTGTNQGEFVSVYVTGRRPNDPAGTMETPQLVVAGVKNYTDFANPHRQGDLSGISVDTDGSFWIANEYADGETGGANWGTYIANFLVYDIPPVAVPGGPYTVNEGSTIQLDGSASYDPDGTVVSYAWDLNYNGVTFNPTATGAKPTFDATNLDGPSSRTIALQVTDDSGVVSPIATTTVTIDNVPPVITSLTGPTQPVVENTPVTLTATISDVPADLVNPTWAWTVTENGNSYTNFSGQGTSTIYFNDTDAPATPDKFVATLTVTDKDGGVSTPKGITVTVVNGAPTASAFTNDGPKLQGSTINFAFVNPTDPSPQDAAALLYSYDFNDDGNFTSPGDILNSSSPTASLVFPTYGTYTVHGRISDKDGGYTDYYTTVQINAAPVAVPGGPYSVNEGATVQLDGSGSYDPDGTVVTYNWDLNYNGVTFHPTVTGAKPTFDATLIDGPATRTIALQVIDNQGNPSQTLGITTVTINNVPPVITSLTGPSQPVVENTPVTLAATISDVPADLVNPTWAWTVTENGNSYTNFTGQGTSSISFNDTDAPATPDTFVASLTVTDKDGGVSTPKSITVNVVNGAPTATSFTNDGPKPQNSTINFTFANPTDPSPQDAAALLYSYDFKDDGSFTDPGDIQNSSSPTASLSYPNYGIFTVHGRISDKDGGYTDYYTTVTINAKPVSVPGGPYNVKEGSTVQLDGSGSYDPVSSVTKYEWDLNYNGTFTATPVLGAKVTFDATNLDDGTRTVALRVTDVAGYQTIATTTVNILEVNPTVAITGPTGPVYEDSNQTYNATVTDAPYDLNGGATYGYTWTVKRNGVAFNGFTGQGTSSIVVNDTDLAASADTLAIYVVLTTSDIPNYTATSNTIDLSVIDIPPTATFTNNSPALQNTPVAFTFSNQHDVSPLEQAEGFTYSYDFNNDGNFTSPGDLQNSSSPTASYSFTNFGTLTVHGRITNVDGLFTDYYTTVQITKSGNGGVITSNYYVTGADAGGGPHVLVYNPSGSTKYSFFAYASTFTGGVRVALGDINGDGMQDIITGAGPTGGPEVRVFDGATGTLIRDFFAFAPTFTGGITVASADFNHDNYDDIVVAAGVAGGTEVKVFSGRDGSQLADFNAFPGFGGAVNIGVGDVNGDGTPDIIAGAGAGGGPEVKVINGKSLGQVDTNKNILDSALLSAFFAFAPTFSGGVYVAGGDVNKDGKADIIVGSGADANTDATIRVFDGATGAILRNYVAYPGFRGGVRVASLDLNGDGIADILTSPGSGAPIGNQTIAPPVLGLDGKTLYQILNFHPYDPTFLGGVFVG